jgi:MFS family permease
VLVFQETGSPLATAALFLGMQFVPAILAQGLVARSETAGMKLVLPLLYLAEGLTFVALALLTDNFVLWLVVGLAAVDGTLAVGSRSFTRAAAAAILKPTDQLRRGNALINIGFTGAGAIGPAIAGIVVAAFGVKTALFLDAASFGLVAVMLWATSAIPDVKSESKPWRDRLREGMAYVQSRPILRRLLFIQGAAFVFFTSIIPIEIVYANETLDTGSSGYGSLLASWGVGMVLGSLVFAAARKSTLQRLILVSTLTVGIAYLGMAAAGTLAVACLCAAVGGVGNGVQWVSIMSAVQELTASRYQARVVGLLESIGSAMPGIGFVLGGMMAQLLDPRASFVVAGCGIVLVVAVAVPLLRRTEWRSEDGVSVSAADDLAGAEPMNVLSLP